jgi:gliding motility-associated protein GldE
MTIYLSNWWMFVGWIQSGEFELTTLSIQLVIMFLGLVFSAVFSGSEVAFFSLINKQDLLNKDEAFSQIDRRVATMLNQPRRLLATVLIGNTFANIIASVMAAVITGSLMGFTDAPEFLVYTIEVIVLTFIILILSEITPKVISINNPLRISRKLSGFIYFYFILLKPLAKLIAESTVSLERVLPKSSNTFSSDDIKMMAEVSEQEGSIKEDEREIIENVIEFGNIIVREIMTSRVNIIGVSVEDSLPDVLARIREHSLSRMPLYENDLDTIRGVIYAKDILPFIHSEGDDQIINWKTISRKALFIPVTKKLDDLLRDFQQEKTHMAVVVDEYGGTEGVVTMDDILEELVGEMVDEGDEEERLYKRFKNGIYVFDAQIDLDDMEDVLERELTSEEDDFETLGGLIYSITENLPMVGERVIYKDVELTVHSVQKNRIKKVRVKLLPAST